MVFYQLDFARIVQVYIVQGFVGIFLLFIAYLVLKRNKKRLNLIFALFYIVGALGLFVNWIYAPLIDVTVVTYLNFITNYLLTFAAIFLLVFILIILKSEKIITTMKQFLIIAIYGAALFVSIIFLWLPEPGIVINPSTGWRPVFSLPYYIYFMTVLTVGAAIPTIYYSIQVLKQFEDDELRKKWKFFIIGILVIYIFLYITFYANYLNDSTFRTVWSLFMLILIITAPILIYYGVGKQLQ